MWCSRRIAPLILNLGTRWRWMINLRPIRLTSGSASEQVWTFQRRQKYSAPTEIRNPDRVARSVVAIRLQYPDCITEETVSNNTSIKNPLKKSEGQTFEHMRIYRVKPVMSLTRNGNNIKILTKRTINQRLLLKMVGFYLRIFCILKIFIMHNIIFTYLKENVCMLLYFFKYDGMFCIWLKIYSIALYLRPSHMVSTNL